MIHGVGRNANSYTMGNKGLNTMYPLRRKAAALVLGPAQLKRTAKFRSTRLLVSNLAQD